MPTYIPIKNTAYFFEVDGTPKKAMDVAAFLGLKAEEKYTPEELTTRISRLKANFLDHANEQQVAIHTALLSIDVHKRTFGRGLHFFDGFYNPVKKAPQSAPVTKINTSLLSNVSFMPMLKPGALSSNKSSVSPQNTPVAATVGFDDEGNPIPELEVVLKTSPLKKRRPPTIKALGGDGKIENRTLNLQKQFSPENTLAPNVAAPIEVVSAAVVLPSASTVSSLPSVIVPQAAAAPSDTFPPPPADEDDVPPPPDSETDDDMDNVVPPADDTPVVLAPVIKAAQMISLLSDSDSSDSDSSDSDSSDSDADSSDSDEEVAVPLASAPVEVAVLATPASVEVVAPSASTPVEAVALATPAPLQVAVPLASVPVEVAAPSIPASANAAASSTPTSAKVVASAMAPSLQPAHSVPSAVKSQQVKIDAFIGENKDSIMQAMQVSIEHVSTKSWKLEETSLSKKERLQKLLAIFADDNQPEHALSALRCFIGCASEARDTGWFFWKASPGDTASMQYFIDTLVQSEDLKHDKKLSDFIEKHRYGLMNQSELQALMELPMSLDVSQEMKASQ